MEKKYNFVYLTTNLINGKQYVGDHGSNDLNSHKTLNYIGSGYLLTAAIKKYGKQHFKREILEFFPTKKEAFIGQQKYIKKYKTLVCEGGYNISPIGGLGAKGACSDEMIEKLRKKATGKKASPETKIKMSKSRSGEKHPMFGKHLSKETKEKIGIGRTGKLHTEESKQKIIKAQTGKKTGSRSKEARLNISLSLLGRKDSEQTKLNKRNSHLNVPKKQCPHCFKYMDPGNYKQYHGDNCKFKLEYIIK